MGVGAIGGYMAGSYIGGSLYEPVQLNKKESLLIPAKEEIKKEIKVKILKPKNIKKIKIQSELPKFLKGKVKEANVLTYELEEYVEETEDGRKIYHEPHKAYEYTLE